MTDMSAQPTAIVRAQVPVRIAGRKLIGTPTTIGDLKDFEMYLRAEQAESFTNLAKKTELSEKITASTLTDIYSKPWDAEAKMAHAQSVAGICFFLWRALEPFNNLSLEEVCEMITDQEIPSALAALDVIREEGNPTENTEKKEEEKEKEKETPSS